MSKIIGDSLCPQCAANGHDSGSNHLIHFEDGGKHCSHAEYHTSGKAYTVTAEGYEEYKEEDISVKDLKSNALKARGIDADISEKYGVKVEYNHDREEVKYYYPEQVAGKSVAYKVRELPKTFYNTGEKLKGTKVELWGQNTCSKGGKKLLITEAQDDCLAAHQMLARKYPNFPPSVVANMGTATKRVADNLDFVLSFDEVLLCFDPDDAGNKAVKDLAQLIGSKAKVVDTPLDVNDMLNAGKAKEFINAFFSAQTYTPDGILSVQDVYEDAIRMPEWGRRWPWPSLDRLTYGRRDGEGCYIGAAVKAGKTEWLLQMTDHIIEVEKLPVFQFKFEQSGDQTIKSLAGKKAHKNFNKPDGDFTQEELISYVERLKDKVYMFNASYSDVGVTNMWDRMKPVIRHAVLTLGVKDIFIDPITQLTDGLTPSETETELRRFSNEIAGMAKDLGFFYYCFCHLKEPPGNLKSHEEGGRVKVSQFRGSRAMAEKTKLMIGIERNQQAEDDEDKNTSLFRLLLNSGFGRTGSFPVYYNEETTDYLEVEEDYL